MIRKGDEGISSGEEISPGQPCNTDNTLWCPTGWVHVERDIDFSDPKVIKI